MELRLEFIPENSFVENGKHHQIYLSDPRRVTPWKLKTVLRLLVKIRYPIGSRSVKSVYTTLRSHEKISHEKWVKGCSKSP